MTVNYVTSTVNVVTRIVIPPHTIIVCEYNITIIAASLVVMQTCFQAIHRKLFPNSAHGTHRCAHGADGRGLEQPGTIQTFCNSNSFVKHDKGAGIRVTFDVKLESRSISKESILDAQNRF
ncbi:hypothetical protein NA56DRAFT_710356 [Hyaloscypha hepaticicola]|uniref:Uncharacterized protein n=1 Tax=Hyaloscypha hepaticicola TaxID=2082293 RepID=A0A2J6PLK6_9HELO|nr:hypothetical protein NA56DRAFT_710356 [Hyaloscypha hepaticicola]